MTYVVSEEGSFSLCEDDKIVSVMQNVRLIIATRKGTVPGYRNFGLSYDFLDKPLNVAKAMIAVELKEAIEEFEPRATYEDAEIDWTNDGKMNIRAVISIE